MNKGRMTSKHYPAPCLSETLSSSFSSPWSPPPFSLNGPGLTQCFRWGPSSVGDLNVEDIWVDQREERQEPQPLGYRNLEVRRPWCS